MPFVLVSAWNKRRRSMSLEHADPWNYKSGKFWQFEDQTPRSRKSVAVWRYSLSRKWRKPRALVMRTWLAKEDLAEFTEVFAGQERYVEGYLNLQITKEDSSIISQRPGFSSKQKVVAIKKMEMPAYREAEGEREFCVEVDILSRLNHQNLVSLVRYCADGKQRFLVYEFMEKGNLQDQLNVILKQRYANNKTRVLLKKILKHTSQAFVQFLFWSKISDFGLAKLMPKCQEVCETARMLGTFYFDPEYTYTGKITLQSDVYAFGVVLLELLTGRRAGDLNQGPNDQNLVLQVRNLLNNKKKLRKIIDADISQISYTMESITMFANLASCCVHLENNERPFMAECIKEIQLICFINSKGQGRGLQSFRTG